MRLASPLYVGLIPVLNPNRPGLGASPDTNLNWLLELIEIISILKITQSFLEGSRIIICIIISIYAEIAWIDVLESILG